MATTLNAGTTAATALNVITDTTGAMAIQTSGTTAIAISNAQVVSLTNPLAAGSGGTGLSSLGTGVATFLGTPSSANLLAAVTDETGTGALVFGTAPTISSANLTGTPVAPTAAPGTSTTQIATTAFTTGAVGTAVAALGTMSTQNANAVAITGGTISGITDLAVADGGTGASTLAANNVLLGNGTSALQTVAPSTSGFALRSNGTTWVSQKLGLGLSGEAWNNVTGSRGFNIQYTNSNAYPIAVSASTTCSGGSNIDFYVNGIRISFFSWQFNGCGSFGGGFVIVPPGATYQLNSSQGLQNWVELY
jgi:hypothetical protein